MLPAPHYRAVLRLNLVDAHSHRKVATGKVSLLSLRLRDVERFQGDWRAALQQVEKLSMVSPSYEAAVLSQLPRDDGDPNGKAAVKTAASANEGKLEGDAGVSTNEGLHSVSIINHFLSYCYPPP